MNKASTAQIQRLPTVWHKKVGKSQVSEVSSGQQFCWDWLKETLQDEDPSGDDLHLTPGFLYLGFGLYPERICSEPEPVPFEETRHV